FHIAIGGGSCRGGGTPRGSAGDPVAPVGARRSRGGASSGTGFGGARQDRRGGRAGSASGGNRPRGCVAIARTHAANSGSHGRSPQHARTFGGGNLLAVVATAAGATHGRRG